MKDSALLVEAVDMEVEEAVIAGVEVEEAAVGTLVEEAVAGMEVEGAEDGEVVEEAATEVEAVEEAATEVEAVEKLLCTRSSAPAVEVDMVGEEVDTVGEAVDMEAVVDGRAGEVEADGEAVEVDTAEVVAGRVVEAGAVEAVEADTEAVVRTICECLTPVNNFYRILGALFLCHSNFSRMFVSRGCFMTTTAPTAPMSRTPMTTTTVGYYYTTSLADEIT
ncbi:unnamed protein product [Timema podura]|uniref:Uncharacterized protein n=1 Tax=Timema podura TaxID=61482 RepID=A0ABN7NFY7_TIMPD|nr:unnamed protein product [Timema podura]